LERAKSKGEKEPPQRVMIWGASLKKVTGVPPPPERPATGVLESPPSESSLNCGAV
jgi:hypothetical protein